MVERGERTGQAIEKSPRDQQCVAVNQALARAVAGATREELRRIGRLLVW